MNPGASASGFFAFSTMPTADPKLMAVLYARVSSKAQEKDGFSIPAQQKLLRQYALEHGISVGFEFTDVETAKRSGRAGFGEMLKYLRRDPTCRIILVEKTDRLYRNLRDWVTIDDLDVEVHFVKQGSVISSDSRSSEKFVHGIQVLMAKNYVDNLSEETRKGMLEKASQGLWPSCAPLGYLNVGRTIIPDPVVAPIIRSLFELYATGEYSLADVTKKAKAAGMVFRKSGNPVPKATIHKILHNRIYTGDFDFDGKRYSGKYEPIIPRELYQRVQEVLQRRGGRRQKRKHEFAFSGLITCGHCGGDTYVREEQLLSETGRALRHLVVTQPTLSWLEHAIAESDQTEKGARKQLKAEYDRLQARMETMCLDRLDGKITAQFYDEKTKAWREQQKQIESRMKSTELRSATETMEILRSVSDACGTFESQTSTKQRVIATALMQQATWKAGKFESVLAAPFDKLAHSNSVSQRRERDIPGSGRDFEIWLPGMDSNHDSRLQRPLSYH
jgi:site-specific DNA recombinase